MVDLLHSLQQRPCSWDAKAFAESLETALNEDDENSQNSSRYGFSAEQEPRVAAAPQEFRCPISGLIMADPVIVESGQSYERSCIQAWLDQGESKCYRTGAPLQSQLRIPNSALKSAISNWCNDQGIPLPMSPSAVQAQQFVRQRRSSEKSPAGHSFEEQSSVRYVHSATGVENFPGLAHSLQTRPSGARDLDCDDGQQPAGNSVDRLTKLLQSASVVRVGQAAAEVRELARNGENRRTLCQEPLLRALLPLLHSKSCDVQRNSVAAVVNLSLDRANKVPVARAGLIPAIVHLLRSPDAHVREQAAAAIFSLALAEDNRSAIGVLGAVPPLIALVGGGGGGATGSAARRDAAMALYYLSLSQINRGKIVKSGGASVLLAAAEEVLGGGGGVAGRALCILSSIAAAPDGREALLECGAVARILALLKSSLVVDADGGTAAEDVAEHGVAVLLHLSRRNFRFKHQALQAGGLETLSAAMGRASPRAKEKIVAILGCLREDASLMPSSTTPFPRAYIRRADRDDRGGGGGAGGGAIRTESSPF